jgi:hypothetical protein
MTGGTSVQPSLQKMESAGVGTIVCMHMQEIEHGENAEIQYQCGDRRHMASDSVGLNIFWMNLRRGDRNNTGVRIDKGFRNS